MFSKWAPQNISAHERIIIRSYFESFFVDTTYTETNPYWIYHRAKKPCRQRWGPLSPPVVRHEALWGLAKWVSSVPCFRSVDRSSRPRTCRWRYRSHSWRDRRRKGVGTSLHSDTCPPGGRGVGCHTRDDRWTVAGVLVWRGASASEAMSCPVIDCRITRTCLTSFNNYWVHATVHQGE